MLIVFTNGYTKSKATVCVMERIKARFTFNDLKDSRNQRVGSCNH